jgi:hypothetical protein
MRRSTWWLVLLALYGALAQTPEPTICAENYCHCDSFTRVICNCTGDNVRMEIETINIIKINIANA